MLLIVLVTSSCATSHKMYDVNDKNLPAFQGGKKVKFYTRNNVAMEFVVLKNDSTFIYGENDSPKIRKDEIKKVELPKPKVELFSQNYVIVGLMLTLLSMMFAP